MNSLSNKIENVENWYVCYFDILGYSKLVKDLYQNPSKVLLMRDKIKSLISDTIHLLDGYGNINDNNIHLANKSVIDNIRYQVLSDSIVITLPFDTIIKTDDIILDNKQSIALLMFLQIVSMNFLFISSLLGYFLRGAVVLEPHYQVPLREEEPENQFIFSKALVTAVELEKKANYPRILIDESILMFINKNNHNSEDYCIRQDYDNQSILDVYGFLQGSNSKEIVMLQNICTVIKKQVELNIDAPSILQKYYLYSLYHNNRLTEKEYKDKSVYIDIKSVFRV